MQLPNFVDAVKEMRAIGRKRYPCKSNRASSIGYAVPELKGCLRRGVYERTHWNEKELWPVESLIRFKEGDRQEAHVLSDLAKAGFECIEQQSPFEWNEYNITGHVDFKYIIDNVAYPVEIKSCSPFVYQKIFTFEDLNKESWLRAYKAQITLYMLMQGVDMGIMIFKDKSSGLMKQINVKLDYELGEYCLRTAEAINTHIAKKTLPDRVKDRQVCKGCMFKTLCLPDIDFGAPLKITEDPEYEKRLDEYMALKNKKKEVEDMYSIIRDEAKATSVDGELNQVVGKWWLTGKLSAKGAFLLKIKTLDEMSE